jgi:hypothetical protein
VLILLCSVGVQYRIDPHREGELVYQLLMTLLRTPAKQILDFAILVQHRVDRDGAGSSQLALEAIFFRILYLGAISRT